MTAGQTSYRPDIDGLRAIAVLSVILFHFDKSILPGGFVGVDIFFVISGYLISLNILGNLKDGSFRFSDFYRRRIKRILPVMFVVVAATVLLAQLVFRPVDAERIAESGLWSIASLANVYFWRHQDLSYFAPANYENLLLHLWSLGVEEQFYLVWPFLLVFGWRARWFRKLLLPGALIIAAISFALGDYWFSSDPMFVYYMLPARAGEFLLGAVAAWLVHQQFNAGSKTCMILSLVGAALIICALSFLSEDSVFPGWRALVPSLGAALIIYTGQFFQGPVCTLLAHRSLVGIGLISYSAYLWHWPVIGFYRYGHPTLTLTSGIVLGLLIIVLSIASYRLVEQPMRRTQASFSIVLRNQFVIPAGILAVLIVGMMKIDGYGLRWFTDGYREQLKSVRHVTRPASRADFVCQSQRTTNESLENPRCVSGPDSTSGETNTLLWGDSNAAHFVGMVKQFANASGFRFRNVAIGNCPPVTDRTTKFVIARRQNDCLASNSIVKQSFKQYKTVVLAAAWIDYARRDANFLASFLATIDSLTLSGRRVIVIGQIPGLNGFNPGLCREKQISYPTIRCDPPPSAPNPEIVALNSKIKNSLVERDNASYFDVTDFLCPNGTCPILDPQGRPRYYDASHLSLNGSINLGELIIETAGLPDQFNTQNEYGSN